MTIIQPPDIELTLLPTACWRATYVRDRRYEAFGNNIIEAVGALVISYPLLSGFHEIRYASDAATQTHVISSGLETLISRSPRRYN